MAKNKYGKLNVFVSIENEGESNKVARKLKKRMEKLFLKKGVYMHQITMGVPMQSKAKLGAKTNTPPTKAVSQ